MTFHGGNGYNNGASVCLADLTADRSVRSLPWLMRTQVAGMIGGWPPP